MSWSDFAETVCKWERIEGRYRRLVAKEALGTITPEESRKLDRYTALRRSRIPPETREARVRAYRDRLLRKALTTIALGRAPTRAEVRVQMEALRAQVREDAKAWV